MQLPQELTQERLQYQWLARLTVVQALDIDWLHLRAVLLLCGIRVV